MKHLTNNSIQATIGPRIDTISLGARRIFLFIKHIIQQHYVRQP